MMPVQLSSSSKTLLRTPGLVECMTMLNYQNIRGFQALIPLLKLLPLFVASVRRGQKQKKPGELMGNTAFLMVNSNRIPNSIDVIHIILCS